MTNLNGRVALVFGAGSIKPGGLSNGKATSLAYARAGARTAVVDRTIEGAEETAALLREEGFECLALAADGRTRTIRTATSDGDSVVMRWRQADAWAPTATELAGLAGRYRNEEIGVTFTVAVQEGRLTVSPRSGVVDTLTPTARDGFDGRENAVWFTRDRRGRVQAMHFGASRVWDFVSVRLP